MIVPELPDDVRALKEAVGRFVEAEVYPFEERIAERGSIDQPTSSRRFGPRRATPASRC